MIKNLRDADFYPIMAKINEIIDYLNNKENNISPVHFRDYCYFIDQYGIKLKLWTNKLLNELNVGDRVFDNCGNPYIISETKDCCFRKVITCDLIHEKRKNLGLE